MEKLETANVKLYQKGKAKEEIGIRITREVFEEWLWWLVENASEE